MLAWRRNDVAQLNHFARMRRRAAGALAETSIEAPGGRRYAEGDRIVALAPDPDRRFVTSQRGTVTAIDHHDHSIIVRFDDTTDAVTLAGEQLNAHHLDHGYATTVHRAQGATADRTHLYAGGGGRELAYVALSRARDTVTVHCVADDLDQALEDLTRDWSQDRRQQWTLDTDLLAAAGQRTRPALLPGAEVGLRLGRLRAERDAILAAMPTDPTTELARLAAERHQLQGDLRELRTGTGRHNHTDAGHAARQLAEVRRNLQRVERDARSPGLSRRQRRRAEAVVADHQARVAVATRQWRVCGHETEQELLSAIEAIDETSTSLDLHRHRRSFWQLEHPAATRRLTAVGHQIATLEYQAGVPASEPPHRPPLAVGGLSR